MDPSAPYTEVPVPALARDLAECVWWRGTTAGQTHLVPPDGCIDIIAEVAQSGEISTSVVGTMTRALTVRAVRPSMIAGIRFRPGGAAAVLGIDARSVTDLAIPLSDVVRDTAATEDALAAGRHPARVLVDLLRELATRTTLEPPPDFRRAMALLDGGANVESAARTTGVSRQHLARRFARWAGVSPKTYHRIARLRRATRLLETQGHGPLSDSALALGFYDQSHMTSEFRELTGVTPARWPPSPVPDFQDNPAPRV